MSPPHVNETVPLYHTILQIPIQQLGYSSLHLYNRSKAENVTEKKLKT